MICGAQWEVLVGRSNLWCSTESTGRVPPAVENSPTRATCPTLASYCPTRPFSLYVRRLETLFFNLTLIGPSTGVDSYRKCKGPSISLCKLLKLYRSKPSPCCRALFRSTASILARGQPWRCLMDDLRRESQQLLCHGQGSRGQLAGV